MSSSLRERALRLLARAEQTRAGLAMKLARHGTEDEIEALLRELETSGLLSDARYAQAFVSSRGGRYGAAKLRAALRAKGVDAATIAQHVEVTPEDEFARARVLWQRKFGAPPADARDYARQVRFLQARGFTGEVVRRILKATDEELGDTVQP